MGARGKCTYYAADKAEENGYISGVFFIIKCAIPSKQMYGVLD